jgi:hypothetical protein
MSTGYPDWSGTRLLHGTTQVLNVEHDAIAPGDTATDAVDITRPGYILELHAWNSDDDGTSVPFQVLMRWHDGQSGDGLDAQLWYVFAGTSGGPQYIDGSGPTKGGNLSIEVTNLGSNTAHLSYFLILDETSFAYTRHDWRTDDVFSFDIPGHNSPPFYDANADLMAGLVSYSLGANTTNSWVLPLYNGPVQLHADTSGAASSTEVYVTMGASGGSEGGVVMFDQLVPVDGMDTWFYAPRSQMILHAQNHTGSAVTIDVTLMMGER